MRRSLPFLAVILVGTLGLPDAYAQARNWAKYHVVMQFAENTVAEYTKITTRDTAEPKLFRLLYRDTTNVPLVYRHQTSAASLIVSLATVSGDALFSFSMAGETSPISLSLCGGSTSFAESDATSAAVRSQVEGFYNSCPPAFKTAMTNFVRVGLTYEPVLETTAELIRDILFPTVQGAYNPATTRVLSSKVPNNFDPQTTPPDAYDQLFGQHYYQ